MHGIRGYRLVCKEVVETQTKRNLTSGDMVIPLVVTRLAVTRLENVRLMYLLDLLQEEGRRDSVM